jgi:adenosylcobinamide-phosphate synthase
MFFCEPLILASAFLLDMVVGDPRWLPHPVRGLGWVIKRGERLLRRVGLCDYLGGVLLTLITAGGAFALVFSIERLLNFVSPLGAGIFSVLVIYASIACRDLAVEARRVKDALFCAPKATCGEDCAQQEVLAQARRAVSFLVSRDTDRLTEAGIVRATVESVAENTVDSVIAPLVYALLGGAPLAFAYRAVNTLDAMVGYRTARYRKFGWAAARLDDVLNFVPALLSVPLVVVAAPVVGNSPLKSLLTALRDGLGRGRKNGHLPEAAFAGALQIQLGGVAAYRGELQCGPLMGRPKKARQPARIEEAINLMYVCSLLTVAFLVFLPEVLR